jgi:hypothetical protein
MVAAAATAAHRAKSLCADITPRIHGHCELAGICGTGPRLHTCLPPLPGVYPAWPISNLPAGADAATARHARDPESTAAAESNKKGTADVAGIPWLNAARTISAHACYSACLRGSAGLAIGHCGRGRVCPREGVGAAESVGQPVPAGHAPDQVRRVGCGHPGRGDEQRAHQGPANDGHLMVAVQNPDLATRPPGCRTRRAHARPGRVGRRDPDRRSRRPPAGPARSHRPGPREEAGTRAGRTHPPGRQVPEVPLRCVRPARARRRHRRPARLPLCPACAQVMRVYRGRARRTPARCRYQPASRRAAWRDDNPPRVTPRSPDPKPGPGCGQREAATGTGPAARQVSRDPAACHRVIILTAEGGVTKPGQFSRGAHH